MSVEPTRSQDFEQDEMIYRAEVGIDLLQRYRVPGVGRLALQSGLARIDSTQSGPGGQIDLLRFETAVGSVGNDSTRRSASHNQSRLRKKRAGPILTGGDAPCLARRRREKRSEH